MYKLSMQCFMSRNVCCTYMHRCVCKCVYRSVFLHMYTLLRLKIFVGVGCMSSSAPSMAWLGWLADLGLKERVFVWHCKHIVVFVRNHALCFLAHFHTNIYKEGLGVAKECSECFYCLHYLPAAVWCLMHIVKTH